MSESQNLAVLPEQDAAVKTTLESLAPALSGLAQRQQLYVMARLRGMNPRQAAQAAGYQDIDSTGYHLEKNPKVRLLLDAVAKSNLAQVRVDRRHVLDGLMDAVRMASNSAELLAAWREIGKLEGLYEPAQVNVVHRNVTAEKLAQMSDAELAKLADDPNFVLEGQFEHVPKGDTPVAAVGMEPAEDVVAEPARYGDTPLVPAVAPELSEADRESVLAGYAYSDDAEESK